MGWKRQSYRHSLASKGISTIYIDNLFAKGNINNPIHKELQYYIDYYQKQISEGKQIDHMSEFGRVNPISSEWDTWKTTYQWGYGKDHIQYVIGRYYGLTFKEMDSAFGKEGKEQYEEETEASADKWHSIMSQGNHIKMMAYSKIQSEKSLQEYLDNDGYLTLYRGLTGREARSLEKQKMKSRVIAAFSLDYNEARRFSKDVLEIKVPLSLVWYADQANPRLGTGVTSENEVVIALPLRYFERNNGWNVKQ